MIFKFYFISLSVVRPDVSHTLGNLLSHFMTVRHLRFILLGSFEYPNHLSGFFRVLTKKKTFPKTVMYGKSWSIDRVFVKRY